MRVGGQMEGVGVLFEDRRSHYYPLREEEAVLPQRPPKGRRHSALRWRHNQKGVCVKEEEE